MSGADAGEAFALALIVPALYVGDARAEVELHRCLTCGGLLERSQRAGHRDWHVARGDQVETRGPSPARLPLAPMVDGDQPVPPPRDIPPDDYAVCRADGSLRTHGQALWRWGTTGEPGGRDWRYVGPAPTA